MPGQTVIEPIARAFVVLEALNRRRSTTLSVLAAETGLKRPTLVRLLHTLIALGYAARVSVSQSASRRTRASKVRMKSRARATVCEASRRRLSI